MSVPTRLAVEALRLALEAALGGDSESFVRRLRAPLGSRRPRSRDGTEKAGRPGYNWYEK